MVVCMLIDENLESTEMEKSPKFAINDCVILKGSAQKMIVSHIIDVNLDDIKYTCIWTTKRGANKKATYSEDSLFHCPGPDNMPIYSL